MFDCEMYESMQTEIEIEKIPYEILYAMLYHLYQGGNSKECFGSSETFDDKFKKKFLTDFEDTNDLINFLMGLMAAAHLYGHDDTKTSCEIELRKLIQKDNVKILMECAELYDAYRLYEACLEFISKQKD